MLASQTAPLKEHDPELYALICQEKERQRSGLELIASENFTSRAVLECLGSVLTNKYAEGLPDARYYGGNEYIDQIEKMCQARALAAYGLNPDEWGVNVQPYSGSPANLAVYTALLRPHDRIMGLDLPSGGHLTHGYYTYNKAEKTRKAVSATSIYFESLPYTCRESDGLLDMDKVAELAGIFKPNLLICGGSAYPREWDYARFRKIADDNGSIFMCDMAHISGLVAAGVVANPFLLCDIVTTTTHKSLRGPRAGMIFFRKDKRDFGAKINFAVFPSLQGGPHEHQIAAIATQLKEVVTPEFKAYATQVKANAAAVANALTAKGYRLMTGGTDNHLVLWDLRPTGVTGARMDKVCDEVAITLNKNTLVGDRNAIIAGGVRIGSPALTSRGLREADFERIADFLHEALGIASEVTKAGPEDEKLADFCKRLHGRADLGALKARVQEFARAFPMPGRAEEGSL